MEEIALEKFKDISMKTGKETGEGGCQLLTKGSEDKDQLSRSWVVWKGNC